MKNRCFIITLAVVVGLIVSVHFYTERNITMEVGRGGYTSTFSIPDAYFREAFNKELFGYREIELEYLYPEMKPLKPHYKKLRNELSEKFRNISQINTALENRVLTLNIYGAPAPISKNNLNSRNYLSGILLEENSHFEKYGKSDLSYYDYHFWIKNKEFPYLIACVEGGKCSIRSSFNQTVSYEFGITEERYNEWGLIDNLVRLEISKFLQ
ncbi:hypothetical protein [Alkalimarinus coralli]|uniref:hypothetical protein n=1 Tax=Alkalimarinus coralli TaxID=2935863 RepID=UPI00202B5B31|nr:hypothetical protein [Alkalimarinus coralli]